MIYSHSDIDHRTHYLLQIDTEATNCVSEGWSISKNALPYDIGFAVIDTHGNVYETFDYVNADVFYGEPELMESAYYADKIPQYEAEIEAGIRIVATSYEIRQVMLDAIARYGIKEVIAHNARFDCDTLNNAMRWQTKSKFRYWFPFESVEWWDSMKMARSVICKMPTYKTFCTEILGLNRVSASAENLYRFISGKHDFKEAHTGLEDVLIEAEIVAYCYRQHKPMEKVLFKPREIDWEANPTWERIGD